MEPTSVRIALAALAGIAGGAGVGWWLRGRYNWSRSVIMDELWTRKIRSFEATTDLARTSETRALSEKNEAETCVVKERQRNEELAVLIAGLEEELEARARQLNLQRVRVEELEQLMAKIDLQLRGEQEARAGEGRRHELLEKRLRALRPIPARLEECETELARVEVRAAEEAEEKNAEIARLADWIAELTPLSETLRRRGEELASLREAELELRSQLEQRREASFEFERELAREASAREVAENERGQLQEKLTDLHSAKQELDAELEGKGEAFQQQRQASIQHSLRVTELQVKLDQVTEELARALEGTGGASGSKKKSATAQSESPKSKPARPKAELKSKGSSRKRQASTKKDDLTTIKGIGPKVAERLVAAGVTTYARLASTKSSKLDDLAGKISVPRKRIEREGWIAAAAKQARKTAR